MVQAKVNQSFIFLQLMENGLAGVNGLNAVYLVVKEPGKDLQHVNTPARNALVKIVILDKTLIQKIAGEKTQVTNWNFKYDCRHTINKNLKKYSIAFKLFTLPKMY